ncbi:MAG: SLBB domain-containing protein [Scytolyngbya sp. HA4215-MV1]|jgi:polysaccharide export outer membrane protein|nr:SLBB domain-containing protein [Scytolyngbya sp. HA4215-MV1]
MLAKLPENCFKYFDLRSAIWILAIPISIACNCLGLPQIPIAIGVDSPPSEHINPSSDDAYTLGPGDRIRIEIFKVTQFSGDHQVLVDGTLNLPQVGSVSVLGLTLEAAADAISAKYTRLLKYPIVTVTLVAPRPVKVAVSGEVGRPGTYTLPTDAGNQLPTVTQALQLAGGVTQLADLRQVKVLRPRQSGSEQVIKVNLWEFLQTGELGRDITLRGGDTVFIPTVANLNLAEAPKLTSASFSTDRGQPLNIAVVGEVYRPGPYTVTASARTGAAGAVGQAGGGGDIPPTITRAIQVAGGIRPQADIRQIQVHRQTKTGGEQIIHIDLWKLLKAGDLDQDLILQDRDTVVIPTATELSPAEITQISAASFSPDTIRVNVVGEVMQPGVVQVPPNTPLNQVLLAAGGFNPKAHKSSVKLIRLNQNGTVTERTISVNFERSLNDKNNPALRNDDVVVVKRSGLTVLTDSLGFAINPINSFLSIFSIFRIFSK